jgi:mannose-6-phosphate isomerase-like protein (cupin superfamily)
MQEYDAMPLDAREMPVAQSTKDIYERQTELAKIKEPTAFKLSAMLLDQGRTDTVLAATDNLTLRLKVYASGGENELHAHPHEDHSFIVLQGSAQFHDANGKLVHLGRNEGLMLPRGSMYRFAATSAEPLVMIRIGSPNQGRKGYGERVGRDGRTMTGDSAENKTVPVRIKDGARFG